MKLKISIDDVPKSQRDITQGRISQALLRTLSIVPAGAFLFRSTKAVAKPQEETEGDFIEALAYFTAAQKVLAPIRSYIDNNAYDFARTNVNYILTQLQIVKQAGVLVRGSMEFSGSDDTVQEAGQEAGGELSNLMTQFDSSIYTLIFIPVEDSTGKVPLKQEQYVKMCYNFLNTVESAFTKLVALGSSQQIGTAKAKAVELEKSFPDFLFKTNFKKGNGASVA